MPPVTKEKVAKRLREIIENKFDGVDLRYAKAAKLTASTLNGYTKAERLPSGENLAKLAQAGNVTTDWILTGRDSPDERRKRAKVFTDKERRLFVAFQKADERAKEDAIFHLERYQENG